MDNIYTEFGGIRVPLSAITRISCVFSTRAAVRLNSLSSLVIPSRYWWNCFYPSAISSFGPNRVSSFIAPAPLPRTRTVLEAVQICVQFPATAQNYRLHALFAFVPSNLTHTTRADFRVFVLSGYHTYEPEQRAKTIVYVSYNKRVHTIASLTTRLREHFFASHVPTLHITGSAIFRVTTNDWRFPCSLCRR